MQAPNKTSWTKPVLRNQPPPFKYNYYPSVYQMLQRHQALHRDVTGYGSPLKPVQRPIVATRAWEFGSMAKQRTSAVSESAPMEEYSVSAASDAEDTSSVVSFQLHGGHIYAKKPSEDTPNMVDDTPSLGSRGSMQLSGMTDESYRSSALFYTPGVEASTPTPTVTSSVQQPQKRSAPLPIYKLLSNGDECHDSPLLGSLPASRKRQRVGRNRRSVQQTNPVEGAAQGMGLLDHIISGVLL